MGLTRTPLLDRLIARTAFPGVANAHAEAAKIDAVRVAVGGIMFYRTALIVVATYYYHPTDVAEAQITAKFLIGCGMLVLLACYTIGLCTPLVGLTLVLAYPYFDFRLLTGTLGSNVASICLITLVLLNSGRCYSADALLLQRQGFIGKCWRTMYGVLRFPDAAQTTRIYFLAFAAYAAISFSALAYHLNDAYWREGRTVGVMLTNAYLSRSYEFFRTWEAAAPGMYRAFSIASVFGQTVFQAAMMPLMFAKWGRRFVIGWGLSFFVISLVLLQLSYLPYLELALWALIFTRFDSQIESDSTLVGQRPRWRMAYSGIVLGSIALFLVLWFGLEGRLQAGTLERPRRVMAWVGLAAPQVFNKTDLKSGEHWYVIHQIHDGGRRSLVPLNGPDGQRLAYHRGDLIYCGNSLRWRRRMAGSDPIAYNAPSGTGYDQIREICYYDYARARVKPVQYEIRVYENRSAQPGVPARERYAAKEVLAFNVTLDQDAVLSNRAARQRSAHLRN